MATVYYDPFKPYEPPRPPHHPGDMRPIGPSDYSLEIPDGVQNIEYITLDISKKSRARFAPLMIRQGDRNGTALIVTVVDTTNGEIRNVDLEMANVSVEMTLPDKETVYRSDVSEEVVDNRAVVVIDESKAGLYAGNCQAYVVIEQDDTRISTQPFRVKIVGTVKPGDAHANPTEDATDYVNLENKPKINGVELVGDLESSALNISYNDLADKPKINGVELRSQGSGIAASELDITYDDIKGDKPSSSYTDLANKPTINGKTINGDLTTNDVVDVNAIADQVALNVDSDTIAQKLIDSGALTEDIIHTASNDSIVNIVANNSDPVEDHSLDRY